MLKDYMSENVQLPLCILFCDAKSTNLHILTCYVLLSPDFSSLAVYLRFVCFLTLPDVLIFNNIDECSSSIDELVPII